MDARQDRTQGVCPKEHGKRCQYKYRKGKRRPKESPFALEVQNCIQGCLAHHCHLWKRNTCIKKCTTGLYINVSCMKQGQHPRLT